MLWRMPLALLLVCWVVAVPGANQSRNYSIGHIRPGYTRSQVKKILGPPVQRFKHLGTESWFYFGRGGFTVDFTGTVVKRIVGIALYDGEEILLKRGDSEQRALELLGSPIPGGSLGSASQFRCERFRLYVTILDNNIVESIELTR